MTSAQAQRKVGELHIAWRALEHAVEFRAYAFPGATWPTGFPITPGSVLRAPLGRFALLHFAPGRWLAPEPAEEAALLDSAVAAGTGTQTGVGGKWQAITLTGAQAPRALAATIDLETVLSGRDCAAVRLFDCPGIVARTVEGFEVWALSSYATDLIQCLKRPILGKSALPVT